MNDDEFYSLVTRMRAAQRCYFKHRSADDLELSKELERQVDAAIRSRGNPQMTLFDVEGE